MIVAPPKPKAKRRWYRFSVKKLAIVAALILIARIGIEFKPRPKLQISKETTYFTGPLDKDGYVDYRAALNERLGKGITPDSNANVLLCRAIGPTADGKKEKIPAEYYALLGMEELPPDGDYFIQLETYLTTRAKLDLQEVAAVTQQQQHARQRVWRETDFPHLAAWLAVNEKPLALAIEASQRSDYFNPLVGARSDEEPGMLMLVPLRCVYECVKLSRALATRAMLHLGKGEFDAAWQDLLACHRLGRLIARGPTTIAALVGIVIDGVACAADAAYLERAAGKHALSRLIDLQGLPPFPPLADKFDLYERMEYLESVQLISRGKVSLNGLDEPAKKPTAVELWALNKIDWNPALRNGNQWYDRVVALLRLERQERGDNWEEFEHDFEYLKKKSTAFDTLARYIVGTSLSGNRPSEEIGNRLLSLLRPSSIGIMKFQHFEAEQNQRNMLVAFALSAYVTVYALG